MESILDYVRRRLREVGSQQWEEIALAAGCSSVTPRKVVYERDNPGVNTIEPLYRYFQSIDKAKAAKPSKRKATPPTEAPAAADRRENHAFADKWARQSAILDRRCDKPRA